MTVWFSELDQVTVLQVSNCLFSENGIRQEILYAFESKFTLFLQSASTTLCRTSISDKISFMDSRSADRKRGEKVAEKSQLKSFQLGERFYLCLIEFQWFSSSHR